MEGLPVSAVASLCRLHDNTRSSRRKRLWLLLLLPQLAHREVVQYSKAGRKTNGGKVA